MLHVIAHCVGEFDSLLDALLHFGCSPEEAMALARDHSEATQFNLGLPRHPGDPPDEPRPQGFVCMGNGAWLAWEPYLSEPSGDLARLEAIAQRLQDNPVVRALSGRDVSFCVLSYEPAEPPLEVLKPQH
jgi:hypothetical protein